VEPVDDASPIALRGRFEAYKSLEFASEVIRQIQSLREACDHRGRLRIVPRDTFEIVGAAKTFAGTFVANTKQLATDNERFASSPRLHSLVTAASQRVLKREIQAFDSAHPERCLALAGINERIQADCLSQLQESLTEPELAAAIAELVNANTATAATLNSATSNLLGCGCDRRTLILVPRGEERTAAMEELRKSRPLAAVVPADVDSVVIVSEESAIAPRSLALGLGRMYPGIAEAAHRLHTRTDIPWENLI
jgi:hypothetical protein